MEYKKGHQSQINYSKNENILEKQFNDFEQMEVQRD